MLRRYVLGKFIYLFTYLLACGGNLQLRFDLDSKAVREAFDVHSTLVKGLQGPVPVASTWRVRAEEHPWSGLCPSLVVHASD